MSGSPNYNSSDPPDAALGSKELQSTDSEFNQQSSTTPAQLPSSKFSHASDQQGGLEYGHQYASSSSYISTNRAVGFPSESPSVGRSTSGISRPSASGQSSTPEDQSSNLTQPPSGHSYRAPEPKLPFSEYQVMTADPSDLEAISTIHGHTLRNNNAARFTMKKSAKKLHQKIQVGYFHYEQAFASDCAVVLKAVEKTSKEIVGCAWLERFDSVEKEKELSIPWQLGFSPPPWVNESVYVELSEQLHKLRLDAFQQEWMPHYFIRALDIPYTKLKTHEERSRVHRSIISFVSQKWPMYAVFAHQSESSIIASFSDEKWVNTGRKILPGVQGDIGDKTLLGWLKPREPPPPSDSFTINYVTESTQHGLCFSIEDHNEYPGISTNMSIEQLMGMLGLLTEARKSVVVMTRCGNNKWNAKPLISDDQQGPETLLGAYGWGPKWPQVWLAYSDVVIV